METNEKVILKDTPDKYSDMTKEIIPPFIKLLEEIVGLEDSAFERLEEMRKEKIEMGIPNSIAHPGFIEFMENYRERYTTLVSGLCTEKLLDRPFGGSIQHPAKYIDAINGPLFFTMKSSSKAIIEIKSNAGARMKHRFVLKNEDGTWKIDEVKYGFGEQDKWYIDHI